MPLLNRMIDKGEKWQDSDEGKEYTKLRGEIDDAKKNLPTVTTDTATMWEIIHSGRGVIGVGSWWGHCNAWSAAAIMDLEPRKTATINGITFTPADVKALLTEAWMEHSSSFFGTRNEYHGDEEARKKIDFRDVTPAAFHIFLTDQIGNKDKSFVIDRFTGSEVWNQPMKAYRVTEVKKLYTDETAVEKDLVVTEYDSWSGKATETTLSKQKVYPVQVTTTFHWVTDGLPPETLTADQDLTEVPDNEFSNSYTVSRLTDDQIDVRTLTYTLYLTKPLEDPTAEILGDGDWNHQDTWGDGYNHTHPDFMWQPLSNYASRRDYENPHIGKNYQKIVDEILSQTIEKPAPETPVSDTRFELTGSWEIKDNKPNEPTVIEVVVPTVAKVRTVEICVDVEHTYVGDLQGRLLDPTGRVRTFKKYRVYGSQKNMTNKCWNVVGFDGRDTAGTWKVEWRDNAAQDNGKVTRVLLKINDTATN